MANEIKLTMVGDSTQLRREMDKVGTASRKMGDTAEKTSGRFKGAFAGIGTAAVAAGALVGRALFDFARDSVAAFAEAEEAQTRLQDAFALFPRLADTNIDKLRELNEALAKKTVFDDDAFASGQAVLAQFDLTGKQLEELTPLLADYAAKTGQDLPTAAELLGKAFLGNVRALKELGINFKPTGDKAKDMAKIIELLNEKVGGFAEKQGQTAAGKAQILKNRFGELKETLGAKLLPVMTKAAEIGLKVVDWIDKNKEVVLPLVGVIAAVAAAQWLWNLAMAANPIGLMVIGIAAVIAALVLLWKNFDTVKQWFADHWDDILIYLTGPFGLAAKWIVDHWDGIKAFFKELPGKIGGWLSGVGEIIKNAFKGAINWVIDKFNGLIGGINAGIRGANLLNPFADIPQIPSIPKLHQGGIVPQTPTGEMLAVLQSGERVIPRGQAGGGGGVNFTVHANDSETAQFVASLLRNYVRANGGNVQAAVGF